jgi:hypothetical protein
MATIDFDATKERMKLINKRAFLREMAVQHPDDVPVNPETLTMLLNGNWTNPGPRALQVISYLRESGFLVEILDSHVDSLAA